MTEFQKKVYTAVVKIPLGQTRSYKWVAEKIGKPEASRAVGQALNRNPFPLLIPCHRVVQSDKSPGGFRWGTSKKMKLLALEQEMAQWLKTRK